MYVIANLINLVIQTYLLISHHFFKNPNLATPFNPTPRIVSFNDGSYELMSLT